MPWSPRETATKKFPLIHSMFERFTTEFLHQQKGTSIARDKRFVVSVPILIGTAIGVSSIATAGVTAAVIAQKESSRVIEEVKANRITDIEYSIHNNRLNFNVSATIAKDLDNIRYTEALATESVNSFTHATQLNNEVAHLLLESSTIRFSPRTGLKQ